MRKSKLIPPPPLLPLDQECQSAAGSQLSVVSHPSMNVAQDSKHAKISPKTKYRWLSSARKIHLTSWSKKKKCKNNPFFLYRESVSFPPAHQWIEKREGYTEREDKILRGMEIVNPLPLISSSIEMIRPVVSCSPAIECVWESVWKRRDCACVSGRETTALGCWRHALPLFVALCLWFQQSARVGAWMSVCVCGFPVSL